MLIFVKTVTNRILTGKTLTFEVNTTDIVLNFKQRIQDQEKIPIQKQRLLNMGITMSDNRTMGDYSLKENQTLYLMY
ncbi:Ubiquitin [uncultured virus]|nr:Ubiquitin [uncultured virus]